MQKKIIIKEGLSIPDPTNPKLVYEGEATITWSSFWIKRHKDGDFKIADTKKSENKNIEAQPVNGPKKGNR